MNESPGDALLEMRGIGKTFPGVKALEGVHLAVREGQVHALLGENGAGKSTLIKILSGAYAKDEGQIYFEGKPVEIRSPHDAQALGISTIYQEFNLARDLTVAENIFLGALPRKGMTVDWPAVKAGAREILDRLGVTFSTDTQIASLSAAGQQLVEIAKALNEHARILILDEPTASLSRFETDRLFELLRRLRADGLGIVFVTHRLDEVFAMSDRVTVLKDGRTVGTFRTSATSSDEIVERMVGRHVASTYSRAQATPGDIALETRDLRRIGAQAAISIEVRRGEIVGIAGLVGAGRTELARAIVGADPVSSGTVLLNGIDVTSWPMRRRLDAGMAFVPEDRKNQGVILPLAIQRNLAIAEWPSLGPGPVVVPAQERRLATSMVHELRIVARGVDQPVFTLSGGNQQRVAIGKWLVRDRLVYVLDEPTRGVDVAARFALYELMAAIAERGGAILMISSDLPEVITMSDRIYVIRLGSVSGHFSRGEASEQAILTQMLPDTAAGDAVG